MNKDLIKRAALSNKYYAEEIEGGYIIPCNLIKEDGTYINLSDNRKEAIVKNQSSFSINFEKDIKLRSSKKIYKEIRLICSTSKNFLYHLIKDYGEKL